MKSEPNSKKDIDLAFKSLNDCCSYIDILVEKTEKFTTSYKKSDFFLANKIFSEIIDILDLYIQLFSQIYKIIRSNYSLQTKHVDTIQNLETGLLVTLKAIFSAKQKEDLVMIGDLLENDLADNLNQWKTQAIPILKQFHYKN